MVMLTLLLLCSMVPLLHASFGFLCPEGFYCPAGVDCSNNSSLCVEGVCEATTVETCVQDISLGFVRFTYEVDESSGLAQPVLGLDGPIECCSVSVTVKVEDISAKGGEDYEVPQNQYIKVNFPAGETRVSFDVNIINDYEIEETETFRVTIFDLSVPYGINLGFIRSAEIVIADDDSATLSFTQSKFYVGEYEGQALPELALSVPVPFDFSVFVDSSNVDLSRACDNFRSGSFEVLFPNGTTKITFPINITDDDVYEGDESFTLAIDHNLPSLVNIGTPYRATVFIKDDEKLIIANFERRVYRVHEHDGSMAPKIVLTEPSPCCFMVHAQLKNNTAHGRTIDYGYASPKIYNYTFHAGSTCAYPDVNITITDDMIVEQDETFQIVIIDAALPFGVQAGQPTTIIIRDNDNAVSFKFDKYTVREDEAKLYIEVILERPATSNRTIQIYSYHTSDNATGNVDYQSGPYDVNFERGDTSSYFSISMIDDDLYEGMEYFTIYIDSLPHGMVHANPCIVKVTVIDDEYIVCFKEPAYSTDEGTRVTLGLTLSRPLPTPLTVQLEYNDIHTRINYDYYPIPRSVTFKQQTTDISFTVYTIQDSTLEQKEELFSIAAKYRLQPNNTDGCDTTIVNITDDDDTKVQFDRSIYYVRESLVGTVRLRLSETPKFTFSVTIHQEDDTAIGIVDYKVQDYRSAAKFEKDGSRYAELKIEPINDDLVEQDEVYYLNIYPETLPDRVVTTKPATLKVIILNDDVTSVTRDGNVVKFSKALDYSVKVTASYYSYTDDIIFLLPGDTEVIFDASTIRNLMRITLDANCHLRAGDFRLRSFDRIYLRSIPRC